MGVADVYLLLVTQHFFVSIFQLLGLLHSICGGCCILLCAPEHQHFSIILWHRSSVTRPGDNTPPWVIHCRRGTFGQLHSSTINPCSTIGQMWLCPPVHVASDVICYSLSTAYWRSMNMATTTFLVEVHPQGPVKCVCLVFSKTACSGTRMLSKFRYHHKRWSMMCSICGLCSFRFFFQNANNFGFLPTLTIPSFDYID